MVFSSLVFVCVFLPVVLILHTVVRNRTLQNILLLAASLLFYTYGEPVYIFLMLISALSTREAMMDVYAQAVKERYRFFSFGDAMFIE